ncbi:MAG: toprim domain-containing protein, partial [Caldisericaceae bacterium]|nr:toprim domain-containing protein [Caldisericaceae bacterium]
DNTEEKNKLKETMKTALEFFKSKLNAEVVSYLENRGVKQSSIEKFSLGYAPKNGNEFIAYMHKKNIPDDLMEKAGLVRRNEEGVLHSYFRNRVMIPIFNLRGEVVAFGGRIFGNGEPKYLNSPDTELFTKGNLLYPINFAKEGIRKEKSALVTEGYFDALILQQEGITNAVCSMGTSFTDAQAKLIKRFAETVYFLYDDDAAGVKGAERAVEVCSKRSLSVKIAVPFEGLDPDEIVLRYGREKIQNMIKEAKDPLVFIAEAEIKKEGNTPQGRAKVIQKLLEVVKGIANKTEAYEYLKEISRMFDTDMSVLIDQYNSLKTAYGRRRKKEFLPAKISKITAAERLLTQAVLQKPETLSVIEEKIDVEEFFDEEYLDIFRRAKEDIENGIMPDPKNWSNLTENELSIATELMLKDEMLINERAIMQTLENLKKDLFLRSRALEAFNEFKETGNLEKLKEYNEILRELKGR